MASNTVVVDSRTERLTMNHEEASLQLITRYPFDALLPGGPLRYVVTAGPLVPIDIPHTAASASAGS